MSFVDRSAPSSVALAVAPGVVGAVALAPAPVSLVVTLVGLGLLAAGTARAARTVVTVGGVVALAGVVVAGLEGLQPGLVLVATAGVVVSWSTGHHVVGLARQLGRDAVVVRSIAVHVGTVTVATLVAGGVALASFLAVGEGVPRAAAVFVLAGVVLLLAAFELD